LPRSPLASLVTVAGNSLVQPWTSSPATAALQHWGCRPFTGTPKNTPPPYTPPRPPGLHPDGPLDVGTCQMRGTPGYTPYRAQITIWNPGGSSQHMSGFGVQLGSNGILLSEGTCTVSQDIPSQVVYTLTAPAPGSPPRASSPAGTASTRTQHPQEREPSMNRMMWPAVAVVVTLILAAGGVLAARSPRPGPTTAPRAEDHGHRHREAEDHHPNQESHPDHGRATVRAVLRGRRPAGRSRPAIGRSRRRRPRHRDNLHHLHRR